MALWLAIPLLGLLHISAHTHRFCAVHQAIEEASAEPTSGASGALGVVSERTDALEWLRREGSGAAHERCALAWAGPPQLWLSARAAPVQVGDPCGPCGPREGQEHALPVPLLSLAPKASPPLS